MKGDVEDLIKLIAQELVDSPDLVSVTSKGIMVGMYLFIIRVSNDLESKGSMKETGLSFI